MDEWKEAFAEQSPLLKTLRAASRQIAGGDWPAFYWLPSDIFGPGKVLVFADVLERDRIRMPCGGHRGPPDVQGDVRGAPKELGSVDIYAEHTMAPTRQMNEANRSASFS